MNLVRVFPTTIGIYKNNDYKCHAPLFEKIKNISLANQSEIKRTLDFKNLKDPQVENFYQSKSGIHLDNDFENISNFVKKSALSYAIETGFDIMSEKFYISDSWFNFSTGLISTHTPHTHSNSFLSAVYFLSAPEGSGSLYFMHPNMQVNTIDPDHKRQTVDNTTEFAITPEEGLCVIFKSSTIHGVSMNYLPDQYRVSLAYNFNVKDLGEKSINSHYNGVRK